MVIGGGRPAGFDKGWYVEPTVFADVDNQMTIAQEEIFGPVLVVIPYDDVADAVAIANDSDYGLSGSVWTSDPQAGVDVARQVRTAGAPPHLRRARAARLRQRRARARRTLRAGRRGARFPTAFS